MKHYQLFTKQKLMQTNSLVTSMTFMFFSANVKQFIHSSATDKNLYSIQRYLGGLSISVENRDCLVISLNFEVLCK